MTRRAVAKRQTRDALVLAALELFAEQGLDGPSLDAICERAGRTRGAFYVHFKGRPALVRAVVERVLEDYIGSLSRAESLEQTLADFEDLLLRAWSSDPSLPTTTRLGTRHFRLVLDAAARDPEARSALERMLEGAVHLLVERCPRAIRHPEGLADVLVTVWVGLLAYPREPERVARIRQTLVSLLLPS